MMQLRAVYRESSGNKGRWIKIKENKGWKYLKNTKKWKGDNCNVFGLDFCKNTNNVDIINPWYLIR